MVLLGVVGNLHAHRNLRSAQTRDEGGILSYRNHTKCRICDSTDLRPVFDLGVQPLANDFQKPGESRQGHYPLKVLFCPKCSLSQLSVVVDPTTLYRHYSYVTSTSNMMVKHFDHLINLLNEEQPIETLVEIGSNDGAFLKSVKNKLGKVVIGIDPAINLTYECGIPTVPDFFNARSADNALGWTRPNPSVIIARHCVAHMNDLREFVTSLEILAGKHTLIAIEIPYMHDTMKHVEFDQIYHEHLNFINLQALEVLLSTTPFHIHRVVHYAVHGGTVLIMLRHNDSGIKPTVSEYLREDNVSLEDWRVFRLKAEKKIEDMRNTVQSRRSSGSVVCGFGASAKASVWINACGFNDDEISFVTDNSPLKPGCLMPGTNIPVIHQSDLIFRKSNYAVMFAWNFRQEILSSQDKWIGGGGRFIIPTASGVEIV